MPEHRLDLDDSVDARLREAARVRGLTIQEYLVELLHLAVGSSESKDTTLELFAQWDVEDATDDPKEIAARQRECDELLAALQGNRFALRTHSI